MEVQHFIFIANNVPSGPRKETSATLIAKELLDINRWAFTESAPLRSKLYPGDKVLIYLAGVGRRHFVAGATVSSPSCLIDSKSQLANLLSNLSLGFMRYSINLQDVKWFKNKVDIKPLIADLRFIKNKQNYGLHLRLPIARIDKNDFDLINQYSK